MNKKKIYWACQLGGWSFYSLINILPLIFFSRSEFKHFEVHLIMIVFNILITHGYRHLILRRNWLRFSLSRLIWNVLLAVTGMSLITCAILLVVSMGLNTVDFNEDSELYFFLGNFFPFWVTYAIWSLIYFMYHQVSNYNKALKYEAAINEIKLNELKSQLNPHFIFNALNSIRALVDEEPRKAKVAITQLSNILRNSLSMDKKRLISFSDELKTVKDYLALEKVRYEERLKVSFELHPASSHYLVPPLMLQTLVENGIKHGISQLIEGGVIEVRTEIENNCLKIIIENSGQYLLNTDTGRSTGYGLSNTKQRLDLLYGHKASFRIYNKDSETVVTEVLIPQVIYYENAYSG